MIKTGCHLIRLLKRSSKIFVSLQYTKENVSYGCHIEVIVCVQSFFTDFVSVCSEER